jgi:V/A-type H+-transporting ATPase subunit C
MSSSKYAYASAKIRALETKLLSEVDIERMVDAPDAQAAFKVLNDTDYADNLLEVEPKDYRQALHDDYHQLYLLLNSITPDNNLVALTFLDRDYLNLKLLFKSHYFGVPVDDLLNHTSIYPASYTKAYIEEQKDLGLDTLFRKSMDEALQILNENHKPYNIDTVVTRLYYAHSLELAERIKNPLIKKVIRTSIDNANILSWIRSKRLQQESINVRKKLIPGGNLDLNFLVNSFEQDPKTIRALVFQHYDSDVVTAFDRYLEKNLLFDFEKALDDYKTSLAGQAKFTAYGPEVIYSYYLAKQNAVANIRIIMTGKLNNINAEEIKKTVRKVR